MKLSKSSFKKQNAERKISTAAQGGEPQTWFEMFQTRENLMKLILNILRTNTNKSKLNKNSDKVKCLRKYHIILCNYYFIKKIFWNETAQTFAWKRVAHSHKKDTTF